MDTSPQWPQGIGIVKGVDEAKLDQRKPRPQKEQAVNCPRCNSTNTKFCYYNNYSLTQPRYFCKTCRRYWTEGGSLRNVPVGGGSRKNKRSNSISISSSSCSSTTSSLSLSSSSKKLFTDLANPNDLNLTYNPIPSGGGTTTTTATNFSNFSDFMALPLIHPSANSASTFMTSSNLYPSSTTGISNLHDLKSSNGINFSLDGFENGYGSLPSHQEAKLFFPMDDLKINVSTVGDEQFEENRGQAADQSNGFWNGMLGGGGTSW